MMYPLLYQGYQYQGPSYGSKRKRPKQYTGPVKTPGYVPVAQPKAPTTYNKYPGGAPSTPTVITPQVPITQQVGGLAQPTVNSYNYASDPALASAMAMLAMQGQQRQARLSQDQRTVILRSGLTGLAKKLFPKDAAWQATVANNPFSDMGEIANAYEGRAGKINQANEAINKENLFFSSYRTGEALPQIYRARQSQEYGVENAARDALQSLQDRFAEAEFQDKLLRMQAELAAAQRAAADAAYNSNGNGSGQQTPPPSGNPNYTGPVKTPGYVPVAQPGMRGAQWVVGSDGRGYWWDPVTGRVTYP